MPKNTIKIDVIRFLLAVNYFKIVNYDSKASLNKLETSIYIARATYNLNYKNSQFTGLSTGMRNVEIFRFRASPDAMIFTENPSQS